MRKETLCIDKCDIPQFHKTLKMYMSFNIANETIDSDMHKKTKIQYSTNFISSNIEIFVHIRVSTP